MMWSVLWVVELYSAHAMRMEYELKWSEKSVENLVVYKNAKSTHIWMSGPAMLPFCHAGEVSWKNRWMHYEHEQITWSTLKHSVHVSRDRERPRERTKDRTREREREREREHALHRLLPSSLASALFFDACWFTNIVILNISVISISLISKRWKNNWYVCTQCPLIADCLVMIPICWWYRLLSSVDALLIHWPLDVHCFLNRYIWGHCSFSMTSWS